MFRRDVKSLEDICLKAISIRPKECVNPFTLEKAHRILTPDKSKSHKAKQKLLHTLVETGRVNDDLLPELFFHESLRKLTIVGAKITSCFLRDLSVKCPNLRELSLSGCFKIEDKGVLQVLQGCASLTLLNLENCRKLSDVSLTHMIHHGHKLSEIDIGGNFNMTPNGIGDLLRNHSNRSKFVGLHISGHQLPDWLLQLITDKLKRLLHLSIGYTNVPTAHVITLLTRRPNLRRLRVHWCTQMNEDFIQFIPQCAALETLDLTGIKTISDQALIEMMEAKMHPAPLPPSPTSAESDEVSKKEKRQPAVPLASLSVRYCGFAKETLAYLSDKYPSLRVVVQ
jgi:hypothetical protein